MKVKISDEDFIKINIIFKNIILELGYEDSEIDGDITEDFCSILLNKLNDTYANI